jgi:hypothetical protein
VRVACRSAGAAGRGAESQTKGDSIWIAKGRRIILDHVSASWSVDETLSASARCDDPEQGFFNVTVQWSIIAENLAHAIHVKGDRGYGSLARGAGPNSEKRFAFQESNGLARAGFSGKSLNGEIPADHWSQVTGVQAEGVRQAGPIDIPPMMPDPAASAYDRVLADAGASASRGSADLRVIAGVKAKTGKRIDNEQNVGAWPALAPGKPALDTDGDGMPDAWETAHRFKPRKADGAALAKDGTGWTKQNLHQADAAQVRG